MKNLILMGPGESLLDKIEEIKNLKNTNILGLQWVFPYTHKLFGLAPDYWTWGDPHGATSGLKYILENHKEYPEIRDMKILIPHFACSTYKDFRNYSGTTPLGRDLSLWDEYLDLLSKVSEILEVEKVKSTTTKNIFLSPQSNRDFLGNIHGEESYIRFMQAPIFGTVEYDGDRVLNSISKWGLENKVSSLMFPLAHYLNAENVYSIGFDFIGSRFYNKNLSRHAWGRNVSDLNEKIKYSLSLVEKWIEWKDYHNMEIYSLSEDSASLLNLVVPYKDVGEIE